MPRQHSMGSFDPFAVHPFTATTTSYTSASGSTTPTARSSTPTNASVLPSPPPSPRQGHAKLQSSRHANPIPIGANHPTPTEWRWPMGASASYDDHVNRALNAPPQSMLAATNVNAHSPSSVDARMVGFSASGFAASSSLSTSSSSSSSSTSNSLSTSSSSNPSPYSTYSSYSSMPIPQNNAAQTSYVFTDFRAEVERYRSEEEDLDFPVLRKGRGPRGGWPGL